MEEKITIGTEHGTWETFATRKWERRKPYSPVNESELRASIPGTIVKIFPGIEAGKAVAKGSPLLELEAMKMVNTIVAAKESNVKEILVKEGDKVSKNELLISFGQ